MGFLRRLLTRRSSADGSGEVTVKKLSWYYKDI